MSKTAKFEAVQDYKITQAVCFDNDRGFAVAHNPKAVNPWVSWRFTDENGVRDFYWGRYYNDMKSAVQSFETRVSDYRLDYPSLTEKYNYLAAAEMSMEDNYNQIDGIPNNGFKPSILEHLRQHQTKPLEHSDKPEKSSEIER